MELRMSPKAGRIRILNRISFRNKTETNEQKTPKESLVTVEYDYAENRIGA
jgi:hypothetical protein